MKSPLLNKIRKTSKIFSDKINCSQVLLSAISMSKLIYAEGLKPVLVLDDDLYREIGVDIKIKNTEIVRIREAICFIKSELKNNLMVLFSSQYAQDGLSVISFLIKNNIKFIPIGGHAVGGYIYDDRISRETIEMAYQEQNNKGFAKFDDPGTKEDFINLTQALNYTKNIIGDVIEVGCYRGSSGSIMLDYAKNKQLKSKNFYFFDVFDGFAYHEAINSSDLIWANTHQTEGIEIISERLSSKSGINNVIVKKLNIITDSIPSEIQTISLANIDVDLYEAVHAALFRISEYINIGGIMICEDAGHTPGLIGARLALEEFINSEKGKMFTPVHQASGQVFLIKHSGDRQTQIPSKTSVHKQAVSRLNQKQNRQ